MKVNITVCGKFHLLNYASKLVNKNVLQKIYYSHKVDSNKRFSLNETNSNNYCIKEYLTQCHGRLFGGILFENMLEQYSNLWCKKVVNNWVDADIVHVLGQGVCLPIIERAKTAGTKVIVEVVNTHPEARLEKLGHESAKWGCSRKTQLLQREINLIREVESADLILSPSTVVSKSYIDRGFTNIKQLPFGVNVSKFDPSNFSDNNVNAESVLKLLSVGQIGIRKGQLDILKTISSLDYKVDLTLVGSIDSNIKKAIQKMGVNFTNIKRVNSSDMPYLFANHDIYISASYEEGLALSICEAMAMSMAVIATKESGAEELAIVDNSMIIYDAGDLTALSNSLYYLHSNRNQIKVMGNNSRESVLKLGGWDSYSDSLVEIYKTIYKQ